MVELFYMIYECPLYSDYYLQWLGYRSSSHGVQRKLRVNSRELATDDPILLSSEVVATISND